MSCNVDIASGEVFKECIDIDLSGLIGITFSRLYSSTSKKSSILGFGWSHSFDIWLTVNKEGLLIHQGYDGDTFYTWKECDGSKGPQVKRGTRTINLYFPDCSQRHFALDSTTDNKFLLEGLQDNNENAINLKYDKGKLVSISDPEGRRLIFEYTLGGFLKKLVLTHSMSQQKRIDLASYKINDSGDLISVTDSRDYTEQYEYVDHLLVRYTNKTGGTSFYAYDEQRRCCFSWQDGESLIRINEYDANRKATLVTDSYGRRTVNRFNDAGLLIEQTDVLGHTVQSYYDDDGGLVAMVDSFGLLEETATYDADKRQLKRVEPGGIEIVTEFDAAGRVIRTGMLPENFRSYEFDTNGNIRELMSSDGSTWKFAYSDKGKTIKVADPLGYEIKIQVSQTGDRLRVEDFSGTLEEQTFDVFGNMLSHSDGSGRRALFKYMGPDCLHEEILPDGRKLTYMYDGEGDLSKQTDSQGRVERFVHDQFGSRVAEIDTAGNISRFEYDKEYNLRRIINNKGEAFQIIYDFLDNEVERRFFDGHVEKFVNDERGRRRCIIDGNGRVTKLDYDEGDRVIRQTLPDGTVQEFFWDTSGRIEAITAENDSVQGSETQSLSMLCNDQELIILEEHDGLSIERDYDPCGHLIAVRDGWDGETIYRRSQRYFLDTLVEAGREFIFRWDSEGFLKEILLPNGMRQAFIIDANGRLIDRRLIGSSGNTLVSRRFRYDDGDHIIETNDSIRGVLEHKYDQLGRLTDIIDSSGNVIEFYRYDANSNLVMSHLGNTSISTGDRVIKANGWQYEYDEAGNRIRRFDGKEKWQYEYDGDGQLSRVLKDDNVIANYDYDLLNRRFRKLTQENEYIFLYDGYALRAEQKDNFLIRYIYIPGIEVPLAFYIDDRWYYFSIDQLGTPTEIWDEDGELCCIVNTGVYGTNRQVSPVTSVPIDIPFLFPGQYYDLETGLCYNNFRYYDPETTNYLSSDPLSILSELNHYIYPRDPLTMIDPEGLLELVFRCDNTPKFIWGHCRKWAAQLRIEAMNRALQNRQLKKCNTKCLRTKQRDYWKKNCGEDPGPNYDIDHFIELQAGGYDKCCANLVAMESSLNQTGMRTSIGNMLKDVNKVIPKGTKIAIKGCSAGKKCKNKNKVFKRSPKKDCEKAEPIC